MAKRKAEALSGAPARDGSKRIKTSSPVAETKANLLDDSDSASSSDDSEGGVKVELEEPGFSVNQEYAKRFEYNKKREERQRLEEKYQSAPKKTNGPYGDKYDEDSESSDDEEEDDEGVLATEELDTQISNALNAIRNKDPSLYNTDVQFYAPIEDETNQKAEAREEKKQKPMYLSDYHRENLLKGHTGADEEEEEAPRTFAQEQQDLQRTIVKEMHAAVEDSDDEDGFLVAKSKPEPAGQAMHPSRAAKVKVDLDIASADKNPETFLSNFLAARAWVPSDGARFQPLESDDDEEDERAERFEEAYNLRFEDATGSNEKLKSFARDVTAAKSVRREEPTGRKKQRENLREKREAERQIQEEERAQLRRLKIEEAEEKLKKIKKAAGLRGKTLKSEEWVAFLDDGWDDAKWESEMNKRFGEDYYADQEAKSDDEAATGPGKKKIKKPKWDDDIDIQDLIPDFDEQASTKPEFTLSDCESEPGDDSDDDDEGLTKPKSSKDHQQEKLAKRKAARLERKALEELVDSKMDLDVPSTSKSKKKAPALFRYRETSPTSFGLTARDILMAPDASLNEFAGLKKMATFRDAEKKRKDKKKLGKKARLRQWRKETFGNEEGPEIVLSTGARGAGDPGEGEGVAEAEGGNIVEGGRKKKKRSRKSKAGAEML